MNAIYGCGHEHNSVLKDYLFSKQNEKDNIRNRTIWFNKVYLTDHPSSNLLVY